MMSRPPKSKTTDVQYELWACQRLLAHREEQLAEVTDLYHKAVHHIDAWRHHCIQLEQQNRRLVELQRLVTPVAAPAASAAPSAASAQPMGQIVAPTPNQTLVQLQQLLHAFNHN
jgi:hypothetical protein